MSSPPPDHDPPAAAGKPCCPGCAGAASPCAEAAAAGPREYYNRGFEEGRQLGLAQATRQATRQTLIVLGVEALLLVAYAVYLRTRGEL